MDYSSENNRLLIPSFSSIGDGGEGGYLHWSLPATLSFLRFLVATVYLIAPANSISKNYVAIWGPQPIRLVSPRRIFSRQNITTYIK